MERAFGGDAYDLPHEELDYVAGAARRGHTLVLLCQLFRRQGPGGIGAH